MNSTKKWKLVRKKQDQEKRGRKKNEKIKLNYGPHIVLKSDQIVSCIICVCDISLNDKGINEHLNGRNHVSNLKEYLVQHSPNEDTHLPPSKSLENTLSDIILETSSKFIEESIIYEQNSYENIFEPVDMNSILKILPEDIKKIVTSIKELDPLKYTVISDFVIDVGKPFIYITIEKFRTIYEEYIVTQEDINYIRSNVVEIGIGNRCCIEGTLHRCSLIIDPSDNEAVGITIRVSREIRGKADTIYDILNSNKSILIVGYPGVGKTTLLRDISKVLSADIGRSVVIVDTTCEIAGEGKIAHQSVGYSRRMKIKTRNDQHEVMLEAVQNHNPDTVIIDEIGRIQEAIAAKSITDRGVQLIATTHGRTLTDLVYSPEMKHITGGINVVTLSAQEKIKQNLNSKTLNERRERPSFDVCIEIRTRNEWIIHHDVAKSVDAILKRQDYKADRRIFNSETKMYESKTIIVTP